MRKLLAVLIGTGLLAAAPAVAQTAPAKIAFVNSERIRQAAPGMREAQQTFQRDIARYESELKPLQDSLQQMIQQYDQQQAMLSPAAKEQRQTQIRTLQTQWQQRTEALEERAGQRQAELLEPVLRRVNQAIEEVRQSGGYTMIFDVASGAVIAADPALDVTEQVLTRLGATAQQSPQQQP